MQLNAVFYPGLETLVTLSHTNESMKDPLYIITSLLNNMTLSEEASSYNACAVLGALPIDVLSRSLKNLPAPVRDGLRERVFVAAVTAGNAGLVSTMLQLNVDPYEKNHDRPRVSAKSNPFTKSNISTKPNISTNSNVSTSSNLST